MKNTSTNSLSNPRLLVFIAIFTALIAIGAFIRIPVPICPFTLQLLFTTLAGLLLGSYGGGLTVGLYIILGLFGLPIFTAGGGPAYIFQPTFGYLLSFMLGSIAIGYLSRRISHWSFINLFFINIIGLLIVYAGGMVYLYAITTLYLGQEMTLWSLFLYCFILAVPGDICLCALAALIAKKLHFNKLIL